MVKQTLPSALLSRYEDPVLPIIMDPFDPGRDLQAWLDTLYDVPYRHDLACTCCSWPPRTRNKVERYLTYTDEEEDKIIHLSCGCNYRRSCILSKLTSVLDKPTQDIKCPSCSTVLVRPWVIARVMDDSKAAEAEKAKGDDKCCLVCQEDFETDSPPLKLSCGHVFHDGCLFKWLSPAPKGGHGNACPTCRMKLFGAWPPIELFVSNADDDEEGGEDRRVPGYEDDYEVEDENRDEEGEDDNEDEDADENENEEENEDDENENENEDEDGDGAEDSYEEEEEDEEEEEYDELETWSIAQGHQAFLSERNQLLGRVGISFDPPTRVFYQARIRQLDRYIRLGAAYMQRNGATEPE